MSKYQNGEKPRSIIETLGFDNKMLGQGRVRNIASRYKLQSERWMGNETHEQLIVVDQEQGT